MVPVRELFIGAIVKWDGQAFKVKGTYRDTLLDTTRITLDTEGLTSSYHAVVGENDIEPLEITDEILVNFDFRKEDSGERNYYTLTHPMDKRIVKTPEYRYRLLGTSLHIGLGDDKNIIRMDILHSVHDLQQFVYVNMAMELEMKKEVVNDERES